MDEQISFESKGRKIYGMIHYPDIEKKTYPGVMLFHGFTGSSIEPHRFFIKIARALVDKGFAVMRFDFSGAGQSEGESYDMDFMDWIEDAKKAHEFFLSKEKVDNENISFLGLSMGSAVLMYLLSEKAIISRRNIFLSPGVALTKLILGIIDKNEKIGNHIDAWGNRISIASMKKAAEIDLFAKTYDGFSPSLILSSKDDDVVPYQVSEQLNDFLLKHNSETKIKVFESGGHTFNSVIIEEEAITLVVDWLTQGE